MDPCILPPSTEVHAVRAVTRVWWLGKVVSLTSAWWSVTKFGNCILYSFYNASSYASAVLAVVILLVCPSVCPKKRRLRRLNRKMAKKFHYDEQEVDHEFKHHPKPQLRHCSHEVDVAMERQLNVNSVLAGIVFKFLAPVTIRFAWNKLKSWLKLIPSSINYFLVNV